LIVNGALSLILGILKSCQIKSTKKRFQPTNEKGIKVRKKVKDEDVKPIEVSDEEIE
jgi:hypothetical protein